MVVEKRASEKVRYVMKTYKERKDLARSKAIGLQIANFEKAMSWEEVNPK